VSAAENPGLQRLADKFACLEKPATSRFAPPDESARTLRTARPSIERGA
jgi:hypothetical protein